MKLIVGLGNPGEKYQNTRHNLGFMAADLLLEKLESVEKTFWREDKNLKSQIKIISHFSSFNSLPASRQDQLLLAKPTTFMNNSGFAVSKILKYYKIEPAEMMIIHDDLDLPFGHIRVRFAGASGGHHGVESVISQVKTDKFLRIRLGIGSSRRKDETKSRNYKNVEDYVLANIATGEKGKVRSMLKEAVKAIELILEHGIDRYISKYNR